MNQFLSALLQPGSGGGWIDYGVVHPQTLEVEEKISYVELLSSDTLIGCGVFKPKSGFVH